MCVCPFGFLCDFIRHLCDFIRLGIFFVQCTECWIQSSGLSTCSVPQHTQSAERQAVGENPPTWKFDHFKGSWVEPLRLSLKWVNFEDCMLPWQQGSWPRDRRARKSEPLWIFPAKDFPCTPSRQKFVWLHQTWNILCAMHRVLDSIIWTQNMQCASAYTECWASGSWWKSTKCQSWKFDHLKGSWIEPLRISLKWVKF
jgi:hypothetical protein